MCIFFVVDKIIRSTFSARKKVLPNVLDLSMTLIQSMIHFHLERRKHDLVCQRTSGLVAGNDKKRLKTFYR